MRDVGWEERMKEALVTRTDTPFSWGDHDCGLFACYVIEAACGIDLAIDLRGRYTTEIGAYKILKKFSDGGIEETMEKIAQEHACEEISPLFARRCDIMLGKVLVHGDVALDSIGVCLGEFVAFAATKGFAQLPVSVARRAWRTP